MRTINILFVLLLISLTVKAQEKEISKYDYGFQIDEVTPMSVPRNYSSVYSVRLKKPLYEGQSYEVKFGTSVIVPKSYKAYTYEFWVFESNWGGRKIMNTESVKAHPYYNSIRTEKRFHYSKDKSSFTFVINPIETSTHITVAVRKRGTREIYDIHDYVEVTSLSVYPLRTPEKDTKIKKPERILDSISEIKTERKKIFSGEELVVSQEVVSVFVYDHRRIDGDIITLHLNNAVVLEKLKLKRKKKKIEVQLKPGKNTLLLYAENLGDVPPNTAAIEVVTKEKTYQKVLKADLKQSEYLTIYWIGRSK